MDAGNNRLGRCMGDSKAGCVVWEARGFRTQRVAGGPVVGERRSSGSESWNNWTAGVVPGGPVEYFRVTVTGAGVGGGDCGLSRCGEDTWEFEHGMTLSQAGLAGVCMAE